MLPLLLALLLAGDFRLALPGYRYRFPRDHFEHPEFRTEWWYYTGNLRAEDGRKFGFELVFFRQAQRRGPPENQSAWRIDDLYLSHLALTDIGAGRFRYYKRLNRSGPGVAGASFEKRRVWNGNWSAEWNGEKQTLRAVAQDIRFTLELTPLKPPVIHGEDGVSRKAAGAGRASHYVSIPRLAVEGELNGARVRGAAWMDHEWFTHQLEPHQAGWDWFSAQLDDGTELMLFDLRLKDGGIDPYSSGTFIGRDGRARRLRSTEFTLQPLEYWGKYPVRWRIRVPALGIDLECAAALPDQELRGEGIPYWEGAVTYKGSATGVGYLEMTGYAGPVRL